MALLPRPFHYVAGLRHEGDVAPVEPLSVFEEHMKKDSELVPFAAFPVLHGSSASKPIKEHAPIDLLCIPLQQYAKLHRLAKQKGCTASAWVGAVLTLVYYELNEVEGAKTFRFPLVPVDARRYLSADSAPYLGLAIGGGDVDMHDIDAMAATSAALGKPGTIPESFWELARQFSQGLAKLAVS